VKLDVGCVDALEIVTPLGFVHLKIVLSVPGTVGFVVALIQRFFFHALDLCESNIGRRNVLGDCGRQGDVHLQYLLDDIEAQFSVSMPENAVGLRRRSWIPRDIDIEGAESFVRDELLCGFDEGGAN